ncbi:hypothetical protein KPH14_010520 [Odynerus spinipes]|uniref:DNA replication ATP-dependent helicase/nuclease n=1 Tax=Odynerus spinipes TaxID=1348599 RepID=A0AAD9RU10_9HYME|nr:hypothetical protein KPH14_010520 [Odynerus spinipes]
MKKSNLTQNKQSSKNPIVNSSQKKISSFFSNNSELSVKNKDVILVEITNNSPSEDVIKKRKRCDDVDFEPGSKVKSICISDIDKSLKNNTVSTISDSNLIKIIDLTKENAACKEHCEMLLESKSATSKTEIIEKKETVAKNCHNIEEMDDNSSIKDIVNNKNHDKQKPLCTKTENTFNTINEWDMIKEGDFDEMFDCDWNIDSQINLDSFQRCDVISKEKEPKSMILKIQHAYQKTFATITCLGFWKDLQIEEGDVVMIQAKKESQNWIIDNNNGFIITQPDALISSTTVVGGLFCNRRAVLIDKFGKIESLPHLMSSQPALTIGRIVHTMIQKCLTENIYKLPDIMKLAETELQTRDAMDMLYKSQTSLETCKKEIFSYVPRISEFIKHYVHDTKQEIIGNIKDNFKGKISEVCDIEENIWLPELGVKGKIDITVEVKINSRKKIMPLEVKTGKTSFSIEHRGQVILYIMMMALVGQDTDSGLLLYLRDNSMREITCSHAEKRDLILLRNTLADYFTKTKNIVLSSNLEDVSKTMPLPEPINHHNACIKCPYNTLCCAYLMKDDNVKLSDSHPLVALSQQILSKFETNHIDYVTKWVCFLQVEQSIQSEEYTMRDVWSLTPEKREIKGTCICNLKVIGKVTEQYDRYEHIFVKANGQAISTESICTEFSENEYIIISTNTRINISSGFVINVKKDAIIVLLDRDITKRNINSSFHVDKYSSTSFLSIVFAYIGGLLSDDDVCKRLRSIVIDRKPATFLAKLPRSTICTAAAMLQHLNEDQQRAILKCLAANEYVLIKGMPGTGKTETIVTLIEVLFKLGCSVIVTSHTNSAVDNILVKLLAKNLDFIRLGSPFMINSLLRCKSEEYLTSKCKSLEELESVYSNKNIVGVTCFGAHHVLFGKKKFDVCIVDESTQVMQPAILGPLYNAHKFILVGDPNQLPPVIKSKTARNLGAAESLFERLDSHNNTVNLTLQYRMNKNITDLANNLTYNGELKAGSKSVENATFISQDTSIPLSDEKWIQAALSPNLEDSVIILDTGCTQDMSINFDHKKENLTTDTVYSNIWEAALILRLLKTLFQMGISSEQIGIMAAYKAQVTLLKGLIGTKIEVNTVDQYQGRDKAIILYSCARSVKKKFDKVQDSGILEDQRRLTVAITRAKHKLIVIADKDTIIQYTPFKKLFSIVQEKNIINLHNGSNNLNWKPIIQLLEENIC